jgi:serine/threonine protein kinase, bacterial
MPLADGQCFAGYTILRHLGSGGMGEIYLAQHPRLPRNDALKVLPTICAGDHEYRERFKREADIAATLWHPHIVGVHDRGEFDGLLWISMDYVEGTDTGDMLQERYPNGMPPDEALRIVTSVAEALDYAHQRGLLHRDVKPANILMSHPDSDDERVLLADFGIARWVDDATGLTGTNMTVGTVAYAAPEQLMGEQLDGRADQYALAATAFHLLTGTPLFQHSNPAVVISQHLSADPPPIGTRRPALSDLGPVFSKALAKAPADRYDSCAEFATALGKRLGEVAAETGATDATSAAIAVGPKHRSRPHRAAAAPSRRRSAVIVAVVLALSLIGASAVAMIWFDRHRHTTAAPSQAPRSPASSAPAASVAPVAPAAPVVPVVLLGADCATLGAAGVSDTGAQAYCAKLETTGNPVWSVYQGRSGCQYCGTTLVPSPTATPGPTDEVYPSGIEDQVEVCVQETHKTRLQCRADIRRGNIAGPP